MYTFEDAEYIYNHGFVDENKFTSELIVLALYMRDELGYKPKQREEELYNFIYKYIPDFDKTLNWRLVRSALNKAKNKNNHLLKKDIISMTKNEIDYIQSLYLDDMQKQILFTFLFRYKKSKAISEQLEIEKNTYKISIKDNISKIKKQSNFPGSMDSFYGNIQALCDEGYISNFLLLFLDCNFIENINYENDKNVLLIEDEENIGYYYQMAIGNKRIKKCVSCGKLYSIKGKCNNQQYCKDCSKERERERKREWAKKNKLDVLRVDENV